MVVMMICNSDDMNYKPFPLSPPQKKNQAGDDLRNIQFVVSFNVRFITQIYVKISLEKQLAA